MGTKKTHHDPLLMFGTAEGGGDVYRANCAVLVRAYGAHLLGRDYTCVRWGTVWRLKPIEYQTRALREALPVAARIARATNDGELLNAGRAVRDYLRKHEAEKRKNGGASREYVPPEFFPLTRWALPRVVKAKPLRVTSFLYDTKEKGDCCEQES